SLRVCVYAILLLLACICVTYETSVYSFFFFSFYCDVDHQDLHSFPTRRSSDLCVRHPAHRGFAVGAGHVDRREGSLRRAEQVHQDRKSTRLNSSHVSISYAVFCLKKKKEIVKR